MPVVRMIPVATAKRLVMLLTDGINGVDPEGVMMAYPPREDEGPLGRFHPGNGT